MFGFFSHLFHILNLLEPTQLCKSEQRPSSLPVGPVLATLGHHQTPTPNSTDSGHSPPSSSVTSPSHVNLSPNTVPEFSYSSSEDEFYDADEFHQSGSSPKHLIEWVGELTVLKWVSWFLKMWFDFEKHVKQVPLKIIWKKWKRAYFQLTYWARLVLWECWFYSRFNSNRIS